MLAGRTCESTRAVCVFVWMHVTISLNTDHLPFKVDHLYLFKWQTALPSLAWPSYVSFSLWTVDYWTPRWECWRSNGCGSLWVAMSFARHVVVPWLALRCYIKSAQSEWVFEVVRESPTSSPGRRRSHPMSPAGHVSISSACPAFLPFTDQPHTLRVSRWTDDTRARLSCRPFANRQIGFQPLEISAWMINVAAGLKDLSQSAEGRKGVRSGSSPRLPVVCLGKEMTLRDHSFPWQLGSLVLNAGLVRPNTRIDIFRSPTNCYELWSWCFDQ